MTSDLYYDPYDFDIDENPYPVWQRLRDEAPLYYNDRYDFYALSRFADVEAASVDWRTYSSAKGRCSRPSGPACPTLPVCSSGRTAVPRDASQHPQPCRHASACGHP